MLPLVEKTVGVFEIPLVPILLVVYPTQMELKVPTVLVAGVGFVIKREYCPAM